jgi:hypothetical protein
MKDFKKFNVNESDHIKINGKDARLLHRKRRARVKNDRA